MIFQKTKNGAISSGSVIRRLFFKKKDMETAKIPALKKLTHMVPPRGRGGVSVLY